MLVLWLQFKGKINIFELFILKWGKKLISLSVINSKHYGNFSFSITFHYVWPEYTLKCCNICRSHHNCSDHHHNCGVIRCGQNLKVWKQVTEKLCVNFILTVLMRTNVSFPMMNQQQPDLARFALEVMHVQIKHVNIVIQII